MHAVPGKIRLGGTRTPSPLPPRTGMMAGGVFPTRDIFILVHSAPQRDIWWNVFLLLHVLVEFFQMHKNGNNANIGIRFIS